MKIISHDTPRPWTYSMTKYEKVETLISQKNSKVLQSRAYHDLLLHTCIHPALRKFARFCFPAKKMGNNISSFEFVFDILAQYKDIS